MGTHGDASIMLGGLYADAGLGVLNAEHAPGPVQRDCSLHVNAVQQSGIGRKAEQVEESGNRRHREGIIRRKVEHRNCA